MTLELRKHCQARKTALVQERDLYRADWQQVADYVDPYAGRFLAQQQGSARKLPSRAKIINSEATRSVRTMDAGFMGGHTSKSRPWFLLSVGDPELKERPNVKAWCDDVSQAIRDVLAKSNFYTALPDFYHSRHLFGIGSMLCDVDTQDLIRFYSRSIGTYAIGLDARGISDSFYYCFERTAKQIDQQYTQAVGGRDKLPRRVQDALTNNRIDEKFVVESLIEPNPDARPGLQSAQFRPFRQAYWIEGASDDPCGCLNVGGHYDNPALVSRWNATGNDCYGSSPALDALGDIKQLQYLEGEKLRLIDLMSKPPLALPDYLRNKGASLAPGERVYLTPMQTQQQVQPIYTPDARGLQQVQQEIATVTERIRSTFYVDLFRMLDSMDDRERTAYELSERKEEKVAMLGPSLESLTDEVLDPTISRVFGIMDQGGHLPPPPEELHGVALKVEYTSMLAQAQKAAGLGTIERTIGFVGSMVQAFQRPDLADKLDLEQTIDEYADRQGTPARIVRSDDDVATIRQSRQQAQKMQQMAAMAKPMADAAGAMKTLSETVPKDGSAIQGMAGAMPGAQQ
jgi:hypothetical protein